MFRSAACNIFDCARETLFCFKRWEISFCLWVKKIKIKNTFVGPLTRYIILFRAVNPRGNYSERKGTLFCSPFLSLANRKKK